MEYSIHPDLAGLHRNLSPLEMEQLEENCRADGKILDPIVVWGNYLLDGRNRMRIAEKFGIPYEVVELNLADIDEAKKWVIDHQLGRRNLSDTEMQRLRAEHAVLSGDTQGVAEMHGVSRRTVQRDMEVMEAQDMMSKDVRERCIKGEILNHRADWRKYEKLTPDQRKATDARLRNDKSLTLADALPDEKVKLSMEDIRAINSNPHLSKSQKQAFSLGKIHADASAVRRFSSLKPDDQVMVAEILEDPDIDCLDSAIRTYKSGKSLKPACDYDKADKVKTKIEKSIEATMRLCDDLKVLINDKDAHKACVKCLKEFTEALQSWR